MSTCSECDTARKQLHHGYAMDCSDCIARGLARSAFAFNAMQHADPHELRDAITRLLPLVPYARARRMIHAWWMRDHSSSVNANTLDENFTSAMSTSEDATFSEAA